MQYMTLFVKKKIFKVATKIKKKKKTINYVKKCMYTYIKCAKT